MGLEIEALNARKGPLWPCEPQIAFGRLSNHQAHSLSGLCSELALPYCRGQLKVRAQDPNAKRIRHVAFSPDGKLLAACVGELEEPGHVTVWDIATGKSRWTHREKKGIPSVAFAPDGRTLAIAVLDENATLLDVASGKEHKVLRHPKEVRAVAFSPDGKLLAAASRDKVIHLWDVVSGVETAACKGHGDYILGVQFSADGKLLLSAGGKDGAKLWDVATGVEQRSFVHYSSQCALITPDDRWVLSGANDGTISVWNLETGDLRTCITDQAGVVGLAMAPSGRVLAACEFTSKHIEIFDLNLAGPTAAQRALIKALMSKLDDDSYEVRETASNEFLKLGFVAEPELRRAMNEAASVEVRIRARQLCHGMLSKSKAVFRGHTEQVECLAFAPDGKLLASGSEDGTVRLWEMGTGKEAKCFVPK